MDRKGAGQAVDPELAAAVGGQTRADLSHARVHKDPLSQEATRAMHARAFAHGDDVFLGPGESELDTELMAHELTHVAQQQGHRAAPQRKVAVGDTHNVAEHHADQIASNVVAGAPPTQLLVDTGQLAPGQMPKQQFLTTLRAAVVQVVEQELGKLGATAGCPYLDRYFSKYSGQPASSAEALLRHWIPAAKQAPSATALVPLVLERVRDSVRSWKTTGKLPPDLVAADPTIAAEVQQPGAGPQAQRASLEGLEAELGPGTKLDGATAQRMSRGLGSDVSGVRIHSGPVARAKAAEHDATAFALGQNVVMGADAPTPGTLAGDALLAHELAHTAQQRDAAEDSEQRKKPIGDEDQEAEQDADRAAAGAVGLGALSNFAGRIGDVIRTGVQLQRCPGPPDPGLHRGEYYKSYELQIAIDAANHLKTLPFATYDPSVQWTAGGAQKFAQAMADQIVAPTTAADLESLVRPELISKLIDQSRPIERDPNTGAVGAYGVNAYFPGVGVEVGNALARRTADSLQREVPRYAQARLAAGKEPQPEAVTASHPIDPLVVSALAQGVVTIDRAVFHGRHPELLGAPKRPVQTRDIKLKPEGNSGMWFRLQDPLDATPEEIATALMGAPTEAFRLEVAHPLYGIAKDTRGELSVDPQTQDAAGALLHQGTLADEAALAQAGKAAPKSGRPPPRILEQMRLNALLLKGSVREAAQRFGLGAHLDEASKRLDERAARLTSASSEEVAKWDLQVTRQAELIARGARGLEADHLRLQTYATQFGADLAADPGAFKLPTEYRQALRDDAELWTAALATSDLVTSAEKKLVTASQSSMTLEVWLLERGLGSPQEAAHTAKDSKQVKADFDAGNMSDREVDLRKRLGTMRAQLLADPSKVDPKGAEKTNEESRDLIFESQVVMQATSLDQAWGALDDADGWMSTVTFDSGDLAKLKSEGKDYYARWKAINAQIKAGKKVEARQAFETLCADQKFQSYLKRVNELLKKVQKHHLIATLIAMVVITVVSMGAGSVLASALGGTAVTVGAGAEATTIIVGGMGVARNTAAVAGFITEVATFTALSNIAFSKDHSAGAVIVEFGKNIVLFGAMRGVAAGFRAAGLSKVIEAGFKADASIGAIAKAGGAQVAEMVLNGGVGMLLAIVEAKVKEAMSGKPMTQEEMDHMIRMTVAQTVVMTLVGRMLASPMKQLEIKAAFQGKQWKLAMDGWRTEKQALDVLAHKSNIPPEEVVAAAARDREQALKEIEALKELQAAAEKDPAALEGTGIKKAADLDLQIAKVQGHADKAYGIEMSLSLRELAPNHFEAPRAKIAEILKTHASLKSQTALESTDPQTGARTWKITPKERGALPFRITEQMPGWVLTTGGRRVLYAARKVGMDDSEIFNLRTQTIDALTRAAETKSAAEARQAMREAELDPAMRDKLGAELEQVRDAANARPTPQGCFVAGTLVWTAAGLRAIDTLTASDRVIATDVQTGVRAAEAVLALYRRTTPLVVELDVAGITIECSPEHPFWIPDIGWREAGAIEAGVCLGSAEGERVVTGVRHRHAVVTVYNLHVDGAHTFHISPLGVLVHNKGNAHEFFQQQKELVKQLQLELAKLAELVAQTTATGEVGKVDTTKRIDISARLEKLKADLEGTKDVTKDLTIDGVDMLGVAKQEQTRASDELASLTGEIAEAKKPFGQRMKELTDGAAALETRRAGAELTNAKQLEDAKTAKVEAGADKKAVIAADQRITAATARLKALTKTKQRIESIQRDSIAISEDPASDSGIGAQKANLANAEAELARIEAELTTGHMLGSKGPQITSKTLWEGDDGYERIDVENPNPGQRPGQIHYQPAEGVKWYYDPIKNKLYNQKTGALAPKSVQDKLLDPEIKAAVDEGMRQLGEAK